MDDIVYSCHSAFSNGGYRDTPELTPGRTLKPKNGVFTYKINNFTPDASRYAVEEMIDEALNFWEAIIGYPFVYVNHDEPVHIEFNFAENGDRELPMYFEPNVLAYAYAPSRRGRSTVWVNDFYDWSESDTNGVDKLYRVLVHELGHCLNLEHSPDPKCITYWRITDEEVALTRSSMNTIERLYPLD